MATQEITPIENGERVIEKQAEQLNALNLESDPSPSTLALHADDVLNGPGATDVAPPLHVSTTFRYINSVENLAPIGDTDLRKGQHVYSRLAAPNTTRLECILTAVLGAPSLTYASGLSAFFALIVNLRPNIIAISDAYHGCHSVIALHKKLYGVKTVPLYDLAAWDAAGLGEGDLVHIESPLNPTGEAINIAYYAEEAHKRGAKVSVDATFGPPPLQSPFELGADIVMHSGSKYLGGHSDMLCGVLATRHDDIWRGLFAERMYLGSVMGSMEGWLGVRSMRTLEIRVERQSENATKLALWLHGCLTGAETSGEAQTVQKAVLKVQHASIQALDEKNQPWLAKQMPRGYGPVFAILMHSEQIAKAFTTKMKLFHHATSLGGCESLIEWRRMSDPGCDARLLRVSVGIEGVQDLKNDIFGAIQAVF